MHGWWPNGEKISNMAMIDPNYLVDTYGLDQVRYFLLKEIPFGEDGNFSEEILINRINSDLANDFGNLIQRVLSMIQKYSDGNIPEAHNLNENDFSLMELPKKIYELNKDKMNDFQFNVLLENIWKIIRLANSYVDSNEPWSLYKNKNFKRLYSVLYVLVTVFINHLCFCNHFY